MRCQRTRSIFLHNKRELLTNASVNRTTGGPLLRTVLVSAQPVVTNGLVVERTAGLGRKRELAWQAPRTSPVAALAVAKIIHSYACFLALS